MSKPEQDIMAALRGLKVSSGDVPRRSVAVAPEPKAGWNDPDLTRGCVTKSNVMDWNKVDLRRYVARRYRDRFQQSLNSPPAQCNMALTELETFLEKQSGQPATPAMMVDYIDFFFDRYIDEIIMREQYFSIHKLRRERVVLDYVKTRNYKKVPVENRAPSVHPQAVPPATTQVTPASDINLEDLYGAFRIHSRYFVQHYGVVLPVNYLMYCKKKSKEEAVEYVKAAVAKLASPEVIAQSTREFGPYPTWFDFIEAGQIIPGLEVKVTSDPTRYAFLKGA